MDKDLILLIGRHLHRNISLVLPESEYGRLSLAVFRGANRIMAGNSIYRGYHSLLRDQELIDAFVTQIKQHLDTRVLQGLVKHKSLLVVRHPSKPIGWQKTIPLAALTPEQVEVVYPNSQHSILRVKRDLEPAVLAPATTDFVFNCQFRPDKQGDLTCHVKVWDIYPGPPHSSLRGPVSLRDRLAFFHSDHPGQPF